MKFVIHPSVDDARLAKIQKAAGTMQVVNARTADEAAAAIVDADAFFGKITPGLLSRARQLRWVQSPTASLEHYLFPELVAHPCQLSNMRGLFSDVIADHVMGYVICFARNFHIYVRQQERRVWEPVGGESGRSDFLSGPGVVSSIDKSHRHLADCTLGVVGVGRIGAEIARRAQAFGMNLLGIDPVCTSVPGVIAEVWKPLRLDDLLAASDFVVIAAPHTPETEKLFRRPQFERMRRDAYLINIGRGAIVDLADLTAALRERLIAGAGLDVFETEPLPADHPLWGFENVIITPHVAGTSPRIAERHTATLVENIGLFVAGKTPATLVDKARWY
ncbi:MAG TPA: D-2-hydroxyacid dehydrogenase [Planctomycetaceae bacterium]|nr:D-2-hydroxyacid dehydrogenase [Planctomycetaceae bacterium]